MIATKYEIKVAEMLINYCFGLYPTESDLNNFLSELGFDPYDPTTSDRILSITKSILENEEKENTRRKA